MGIGRDIREHWQDRDTHRQIKEENANHINTVLYMRDILPQKKKKNESNGKISTK